MSTALNAKHMNVQHASFTDVQGNYNYTQNNIYTAVDGLRILFRHAAGGAMHNSEDRFDAPRCHPDTREAVIGDIMSWISQNEVTTGHESTRMLWMTGPAGAGKSAIQQTIAERCSSAGILAASFFFFHASGERNNKSRLVATLAYQIALSTRNARRPIAAAVEEDVSVFQKNLGTQMQRLIVEPLQEASLRQGSSLSWPKVILIDGLDECTGEDHQIDILQVLQKALECRDFPFRIIVASRPERAIRNLFRTGLRSISHFITLDDKYDPDADISLFLSSKFLEIYRRQAIANVGETSSWPSHQDIVTLVRNASGQFVYASTVVKFVDDHCQDPVEQLRIVLATKITKGDPNPFATLDALYTTILLTSPKVTESIKLLRRIHELLTAPTYWMASNTHMFFQMTLNDAERILGTLRSLLHIPDIDDQGSSYRFHHRSFVDFLCSEVRSKDMYIPEPAVYSEFTRHYLMAYCNPGRPLKPGEKLYNFHERCTFIKLSLYCRNSTLGDKALLDALAHYDVGWWIQDYIKRNKFSSDEFNVMFEWVHLTCSWHSCTRVCRKWRSAILHFCREKRRPIPSIFTRFFDKFNRSKVVTRRWDDYFEPPYNGWASSI